jgi:hypothetical protein
MARIAAVATQPAVPARTISGPLFGLDELKVMAEKPTPANGWQAHPQLPTIKFLTIATVGTGSTVLYLLAPNTQVPPHKHGAGGEHTLMVAGSISANGLTLKPGETLFRPEGSVDGVQTVGPEGALLLVTRQEPVKPLPPQYQRSR